MWPVSALVGAMIVLFSAARIIRQAGIPLTPVGLERPLVRRQAALMPSFGAVSLLSALEYQLDVILLSAMRSPREVGIYAAACTVMNIVALIPQAYRTVLYPDLIRLRSAAPKKLRALISRAARNMAALGIVIATGVTLTAPWLISHVFGPRFYGSQQTLQVLIWNVVFMFVNVPLVRYLVASGRQNRVAGVLLISTGINLVANLLLIPTLGAVGSAWSRLASSAVFMVIVGVYVTRQLQRARDTEPAETEVVK
jgi:O-antigen/teichoic acid export membrane protein